MQRRHKQFDKKMKKKDFTTRLTQVSAAQR